MPTGQERDGGRGERERRDGDDHGDSTASWCEGREKAGSSLGPCVSGVPSTAVAAQDGSVTVADSTQQIRVTPIVVRQQRLADRQRFRRDIPPWAGGHPHF